MKNPKVRQVVLPLITALIWGSAFVTQSLSAAHLGCFSFNALRAIPAVLVLLVLPTWETNSNRYLRKSSYLVLKKVWKWQAIPSRIVYPPLVPERNQ